MLCLQDISIVATTHVRVMYTSANSLQADSLEASQMGLVGEIKQKNQHQASQLPNEDGLLLSAANVNHVLSSAAVSMFGGIRLLSSRGDVLTLAWNNTCTA